MMTSAVRVTVMGNVVDSLILSMFLFLCVVMRQNGPNDCHDDTKTIP